MSNKYHFLLDMDGVLSDFFRGALEVLNKKYDRNITIEEYIEQKVGWEISKVYGISMNKFWEAIESEEDFWLNLEPYSWTKSLYKLLTQLGEVTIATSPSSDPNCAKQKLQWLDRYLGVKSNSVMMGSKKYLMAGSGILVDDYHKNIEKFRDNGGQAILLPSNWNTPNLTFDTIKKEFAKQFIKL